MMRSSLIASFLPSNAQRRVSTPYTIPESKAAQGR